MVLIASLTRQTGALSLQGAKCLVTGASGGIGAGIAVALAKRGARVLVHYNTRKEGAEKTCAAIQALTEEGSGTCEGIIQCDFRSQEAMTQLFETIDNEIWPTNNNNNNNKNDSDGSLDVLVNNAGLITKLASDDDDENLSAWHELMAVNLHAPLYLSRLAYRRMKHNKRRGGSVILNVSSIHASRSVEWMTAYAASKAALDSLTRGLSLEYANEGVRVNAIAPGIVPVERTQEVLSKPESQELWNRHLPVGRMGTVEEIGEASIQLITNEWITGSVVQIDGGMMARANMPNRPRPPPLPSAQDNDKDAQSNDNVCHTVSFDRM